MKLTDAIESVLGGTYTDEARRIVEGHLRHLKQKEEDTNDGYVTIEGQVHAYVEYHFTPGGDFGLAYNENRVWVCMDGVSLFRAEAVGDKLFSEYHPTTKQYKWRKRLKGTSHDQQVEFARSLNDERKKLIAERNDLRRQLEELEK